jgi:hypothetical protein
MARTIQMLTCGVIMCVPAVLAGDDSRTMLTIDHCVTVGSTVLA